MRIDLNGRVTVREREFQRTFSSVYFRTNSNSFFSAGINGESVKLHPDSWLATTYGNVFANGEAKLTLLSGGKD